MQKRVVVEEDGAEARSSSKHNGNYIHVHCMI